MRQLRSRQRRRVVRQALALGAALGLGLGLATRAPSARAGQTCTSGPFVKGVDVYDGQGAIDWATAKAAGIDFGIAKASQGTYDTDSQFAASWAAMKAAGVVRGAYHFLDPTESGVDQANFFLGIVGTLEAGDLPPVLDIECPSGNTEPNSDNCLGTGSSGDATGTAITTVMNDWLTTIKTKTGRTAIVYSFGSYFADDSIDTSGLASYPLYIAYPTTSDCFDFPSPWTAATFWQYDQSATIAGIGSGSDVDYFLGTAADLTTFIQTGTAPIPDAGAVDAGATCTVSSTGAMGVCITTTACAAMTGAMSTPDFCPGPADIQCCTSPAMQGMDASVGSGAGSSSTGTGAGSGGSTTGPGSGVGTATTGAGSTSSVVGSQVDAGPANNGPSRDGSIDGAPADDGALPGSSGGCTTSPRARVDWTPGLLALGLAALRRKRTARRA